MSSAKPLSAPPRPVRIIHLEDSLLDQELVAEMLGRSGISCEFVYADNRESFQIALEGEKADLIISDFSLPGYDGARALEVARRLREDLPFIFFSGTLGEEAAVESLRNGATDYVLKQRPERLVVAVRRALADAEARAARQQIEEELKQRDARFRKIMENVEDLVAVVDLRGRLTLSSPSHRKLFGESAPVVGDDFLTHAHPEDREQIMTAFQRTIDEGVSSRVEYRVVLPGDGFRIIEAQGSAMNDESARAQFVLWVARDITDRRVAEEQILEQAALLDEARDAICVTDLDQRLLFWNKSAERLYGWESNEALGRNANELLNQSRVALTALKTLIQRGEWRGELQHTTRAGKRLVVESRWTLIRAGEIPKSILVINTDITERKRAEQKIQEQAALLDKARDAILVCDREGRIVYWNEGATRLYGWPPGEAVGALVEDLLFRKAPVDWPTNRRLVEEKGEWIGELRQRTRDDKEVIVQCRQTLVCDAAGRPTSVLYINSDITEQKLIEAQFLRTQRMESIGALAGGIAHDLNNVLGPIMMAIEVVQQSRLSASDASLLELAGTSARRGADLVKQILSFARGVDAEKVSLQVRQLVVEVVKLAGDTFSRAISVRSIVPDDLPEIQGDATQLHQVLLNLCVNARDAMPDGGTLTIVAAPTLLKDHVTPFQSQPLSGVFIELKVTDTGTGIPPAVLPKIFEPFFTTKDLGKGTGLGLSTVLGIVKGHGGFVEVASEIGQGTTFRIYLPVVHQSVVVGGAVKGMSPPQGRNECILLVDDEAAILEITRATLGAFNYQALTANSGGEALAVFAQRYQEIDLVITDMMMPSMGGPTLVTALLQIKPELKIIAVSGLPPENASEYPPGIKSFLRKPYTTALLLGTVRAVLDA
jgi:PAS domain S-box-containing protein